MLLSTKTHLAWFPDIAVDGDGRIHVVYDTRDVPLGEGQLVPGIMYTVYRDGAWSEPNDLVLGDTGNIFRPALAVDHLGRIHMTRSRGIWYHQASVDTARSAAAWYRHTLDSGIAYISDVTVDSQGTVHVAYETWVSLDVPIINATKGTEVVGLADVFYRRSYDGGRTWSAPLNLSRTPDAGSYGVQLKIDAHDAIHVTWGEGWDRWALYGEPREGVYRFSTDGGQSWSEPTVFSQPENTNAQTTAASDNRGGVLVVWRATSIDSVFYSWSTDGGRTWSSPEIVPDLYARAYGDTTFDAYDMATDSAGHIHLVAVGRPRPPADRSDRVPLGVYHLVWDGVSWSAPEPIAVYSAPDPEAVATEDEGFPEYPRVFVSEGNKLHAVWFVRDQQFGGEHYRILYSSGLSPAPHQTPAPLPPATSTPPPTSTPLPPPTVTPFPTLGPGTSQIPPGLYTENDELGQLALALSPVLLIVIGIAAVRWQRKGR